MLVLVLELVRVLVLVLARVVVVGVENLSSENVVNDLFDNIVATGSCIAAAYTKALV
jgi:hypothetical protein